MDNFRQIVDNLLRFLLRLGDLIVGVIVAIEVWARGQLTQLDVTPPIQTVILVALAVVLILASLRLFGGLIRIIVVLVLILIALHIVMPVLQH